ncbi:two-component sensor histidine kinase [Streptomyces sp. WAC05374]|uniref:sensor histidine kinase n=1 Tax=Streptomyces sp. WAC05374 TaxID=2487420 RepID=UPI000F87748D|nr:histidine kinase [Streptomyces sp. WAC05374]RST19161.1 two-component sensor histidine kinase [Streptomyces sp. WAC05374]TDF38070.1 two-component sensor histidine kinase [Streptomyces sp. WAC05374]TDF53529.1 two-component sensor histidine kinase [Streptomyces sp. WAC05374]TDF59376.1 two-component sensor histidine kinase [Streptomyces sp. WAC05374]
MRLPRTHRDDALIAAAGFACGLLLWSFGLYTQGPSSPLPGGPVVLVPLAAMTALALLRRTMPRTALLVGTVAVVADQFTRGNLLTVVMFADIVYAAVVYGPPASARRIPVTTGLITIAVTLGFLAWFRQPEALLIGVVTALLSFFPAITGAVVRNHRQAADTARLRAEQTALLAEMDRRQAVIAERSRMARELHDMVANHLSAIAIHSTAALSLDDPKTSRDALGVIRENSVDGLAEMRRLIGLLRDSSGHDEPAAAPTLDGLDALVRQAGVSGAAGGLTFRLVDDREPDARLPAPVELAAYRIVQESLTNTLKHADAGEVTVALRSADHALTVQVTSAFGARPGPRAPGSGAGLVGMRERIALLGGVFEAGPVDDRGVKIWRVRAELPVAEDDKEPQA